MLGSFNSLGFVLLADHLIARHVYTSPAGESSGAGSRRGEYIKSIKRTEAASNDLTSAQ
jgi:hypothetical protein